LLQLTLINLQSQTMIKPSSPIPHHHLSHLLSSITSRGSISMKTAVLKPSERNKFEVHSSPSRGHHHHSKWYLRANHPVKAHRWTEVIGKSIEWVKQGESGERRWKSAESDSSVGIKSTYSKGMLVKHPESIIGSTSQNAQTLFPNPTSPSERTHCGPHIHPPQFPLIRPTIQTQTDTMGVASMLYPATATPAYFSTTLSMGSSSFLASPTTTTAPEHLLVVA
jgi:hypothetical protein